MTGNSFPPEQSTMAKPLEKPFAVINRLIDLLVPHSAEVTSTGLRGVIPFRTEGQEPVVILLIRGTIDSFRTADDLLFASAEAPAIFGLMGSEFRYASFSFRLRKGYVARVIPLDLAITLISEQGFVRDLLVYLSYLNDYQVHRAGLLINRSSYDIVCDLLQELEQKPQEMRNKMSVANYILSRSNLARSGIMKILSDLRQGEYIDIQNGKLMSILKKLPTNY